MLVALLAATTFFPALGMKKKKKDPGLWAVIECLVSPITGCREALREHRQEVRRKEIENRKKLRVKKDN